MPIIKKTTFNKMDKNTLTSNKYVIKENKSC